VSGSFVSPALRAKIRGLMSPVAIGLGRLGLSPNALTVIGFIIAVVAAIAASLQAWLAAGLLVIFGGVFDLFDGALARATNRVSRAGGFLDATFDRWSEGVVSIGVAIGCLAEGFSLGAVLAMAAMSSAFMVSYTRARAESFGFSPGNGLANVGLAPREVRLVIMTVGLVLTGIVGTSGAVNPVGSIVPLTAAVVWSLPLGIEFAGPTDGQVWLFWSLLLIAVLATITTIQRIVATLRQATDEG
jgi:phosphatidylglycerophosphate synthase